MSHIATLEIDTQIDDFTKALRDLPFPRPGTKEGYWTWTHASVAALGECHLVRGMTSFGDTEVVDTRAMARLMKPGYRVKGIWSFLLSNELIQARNAGRFVHVSKGKDQARAGSKAIVVKKGSTMWVHTCELSVDSD